MNLLLALWIVGCGAAVTIAVVIPDEVWQAVAERIRNPQCRQHHGITLPDETPNPTTPNDKKAEPAQ